MDIRQSLMKDTLALSDAAEIFNRYAPGINGNMLLVPIFFRFLQTSELFDLTDR